MLNMVVDLLKVVPPNGLCRGCVLRKHNHIPFNLGKAW